MCLYPPALSSGETLARKVSGENAKKQYEIYFKFLDKLVSLD